MAAGIGTREGALAKKATINLGFYVKEGFVIAVIAPIEKWICSAVMKANSAAFSNKEVAYCSYSETVRAMATV